MKTQTQQPIFGKIITLESPELKVYPLLKKRVKIYAKVVEKIGYKYQAMHLMSDGTTSQSNMREVFTLKMLCQGNCNIHNSHHGWSKEDVSDIIEATGYVFPLENEPVQVIL